MYLISISIYLWSFNVDGLSAAGLRVILQPTNKDGRPDGFFRVLWGTKDPTNKVWMNSEVLYTYNKEHQVWLLIKL